ncbi:MAG: RNA polymerase sigma factor [Paludibacter sp.]|jgi:RNA polymerase sigma-70 factor (ECF subfamily)|nr:RNA polymerase sigma factor [Paludibacter sp.]
MTAESFKKTFLPYHKKLYLIACRILHNQQDAEDAVQESYIKLWNQRDKTVEIIDTEAFAVVTLRNVCLDKLKSVRQKFDQPDENQADNALLDTQIENSEQMSVVLKIIETLPEYQRIVVQMKHFDDLSFNEIAQATGLTEVNIRVLLSRARKNIKEKYLQYE